jgi:hypothetical protein
MQENKKEEGNYYCAGIVSRINRKKKIREFLIIKYYINPHNPHSFDIKFPGGGNDREDTNDPKKTLHRELITEEELGTGKYFISEPLVKELEKHIKYFYLITIGDDFKLRKLNMMDRGKNLGPPEWVALDKLLKIIYTTHKPPLIYFNDIIDQLNFI